MATKTAPAQAAAQLRSPEERQQGKINTLQGKRWLIVREQLFASLHKATLADLTVPIDSLIAIFGLPFKEESSSLNPADAGLWDYIFHTDGKFPTMKQRSFDTYWRSWAVPDEVEEVAESEPEPETPIHYDPRSSFDHSEPDTTREDALWPAVQHVLLGLLPVPKRISDVPQWEPHYKAISKLIKFPILSTKIAADLQILPPKCWGKVDPHTLKPIITGKAA